MIKVLEKIDENILIVETKKSDFKSLYMSPNKLTTACPFPLETLGVFYTWSKFMSHFLILPFHLKVSSTGKIEFKATVFQKVFCWILHCFNAAYYFSVMWDTFSNLNLKEDPSQIYSLIFAIGYNFVCFYFSVLCLRNSGGIKSLFKVVSEALSPQRPDAIPAIPCKIKYLMSCLCGIHLFVCTLEFLRRNHILEILKLGGNSTLRSTLVDPAAKILFDRFASDPSSFDNYGHSFKLILALVYLTWNWSANLVTHSTDLFIAISFLSFYFLSTEFWTDVNRNDDFDTETNFRSLKKVLRKYRELDILVDKLNEILGIEILVYVASSISFATLFVMDILNGKEWLERGLMVYYLTFYIGFLIPAAQGHRKIEQFKRYVYTNGYQWIDPDLNDKAIQFLLAEVTDSEIGLKGLGMFVISYRFLGSLINILATYVVIMLQFQSSDTNNTSNNKNCSSIAS